MGYYRYTLQMVKNPGPNADVDYQYFSHRREAEKAARTFLYLYDGGLATLIDRLSHRNQLRETTYSWRAGVGIVMEDTTNQADVRQKSNQP